MIRAGPNTASVAASVLVAAGLVTAALLIGPRIGASKVETITSTSTLTSTSYSTESIPALPVTVTSTVTSMTCPGEVSSVPPDLTMGFTGSISPLPVTGAPVFDSLNGDFYAADTYNGNGTVYVVSPATDAILATIAMGSGAREPLFDPCNGDIYVPLLGAADDSNGTVSVVSGVTNTIVASIAVGISPNTPMFDPLNDEIYVPDFNEISVLSAATNALVSTLAVPGMSMLPPTPTLDTTNGDIYMPIPDQGSVLAISGTTNTAVGAVYVGTQPATPLFDPQNGDIYVPGHAIFNQDGQYPDCLCVDYDDIVSVISGSTNSVVSSVVVGSGPTTPLLDMLDGDIYVPDTGGGSISVISAAYNGVVATITLGGEPIEAAPLLDSTAGDIYVVCNADGPGSSTEINVISGTTNGVVATIPSPITAGVLDSASLDLSTGEIYVPSSTGTLWIVGPVSDATVSTTVEG